VAGAQAAEIWDWLAHITNSREYFDAWLNGYLKVRPYDHVVEIGWTWLPPSAWGMGANVERSC
jgi:hypothetical protein